MAAEKTMRVLVAEPNAPMHKIIGKLLAENGYTDVHYAASADEAWEKLEQETFDFAVLDWTIAADKELDLIWKITDHSRHYALRMLLMGQGAPIGVLDEAMRLGVRDYINKPFTPYLLGVKVDKVLYGQRSPVERAAKAKNGRVDTEAKAESPASRASAAAEARAAKAFAEAYEMLQLRKYDQAISKFAQSVRRKMLFPEAYKGIAEAFRGKGDLERSMQFLSKAAETYAWLDRDDEATSLFHRARKGDPKAPNPFKTVAEHLRGNKDHAKTVGYYERAAKLTPNDPDVVVGLARAYVDTGRKDKASEVMAPLIERGDVPKEFQGLFADVRPKAKTGPKPKPGLTYTPGRASYSGAERRRAARVPLAEYATDIPRRNQYFPIIDVSMVGVSFKPMGEAFEEGQDVEFDLVTMGEPKSRKIKAVVRRMGLTFVGCEFQELTKRQIKQLEAVIKPRQ